MSEFEPTEYKDLPTIQPNIEGLQLGEVRQGAGDRLQAYFGGDHIEHLTPHDSVDMREGAIHVDMYTIDGRNDTDYAKISIRPPAVDWDGTKRGKLLRGMSVETKDLVERTPVQTFVAGRGFMDIPISGRARWLAVDPSGEFSTGVFDDKDPKASNSAAMFGKGWTFAWVAEGTRPFVFGELCSPRFIDQTEFMPKGEDGIRELNTDEDLATLPPRFKELLDYYTNDRFDRRPSRAA